VADLVINLLSSKPDQTSIGFQYTAGIVPFVVAASVLGAARFKGRADGLSLAVCIGAGVVAISSPLLFLGGDVRALGSPVDAAKAHALGLIPSGVPVAASNELGGHLSERRYIYEFPYIRRARWIVLDINDITQGDASNYKKVVRNFERNKAWRIVFSSHGIAVLHMRATARS
jgi:hypothetical protein